MKKPKPCPFCDTEPEIIQSGDESFNVECLECGAWCTYYETEKEAVSVWDEAVTSVKMRST